LKTSKKRRRKGFNFKIKKSQTKKELSKKTRATKLVTRVILKKERILSKK
jgi:hypothetical protein